VSRDVTTNRASDHPIDSTLTKGDYYEEKGSVDGTSSSSKLLPTPASPLPPSAENNLGLSNPT